MTDLMRDAPIGQLIRYFTRNRVLLYPEEKPGFQCPPSYSDLTNASRPREKSSRPASPSLNYARPHGGEEAESPHDLHTGSYTARSSLDQGVILPDLEKQDTARSTVSQFGARTALQRSHTRSELDEAFHASSLTQEVSRPIEPQRTSDGNILVDWYTTDDPENPHNWSQGKKAFAALQICLYTLAVYMGSAIYTPSVGGVEAAFGVSTEAASLGLSLYVLAYGTGPLIFSPLSEIPSIGRNPPYMITMFIFVVLCVPTALVENFAGLLVLRFLQGFFGSPCLATGGASMQDLYSLIKLPYILCLWAFAATCGPALGPVISGFSVPAENWRWSLWEILWLAGPIFISMMLFLPETSTPNILLRRAQRLRNLTGNPNLKAQSEIDQANMRPKDVAFEALVRPIQLIVMDPAIGFTALYVALCYGIYYSFFEVFPLVYIDLYGFNIGQMGLTFLSITVAVVISIAVYWAYIWYVVEPDIRKNGLGAPEKRLLPAVIASFLLPVGLFLYGWTGNGEIYWFVSVVGIFLFTCGVFIVMQCVFVYLPMVYPQYAASLFAGNDFARSLLAFAAIMFAR